MPATRNYLETWGRDWPTDIPYYLRYLFSYSSQLNTDRQRKEYVVLSEIMSDEVNAYSDDFKSQVLESINDTAIRSLDDAYKALEQSAGDFYIIKFMGSDRPLIIDAKKARLRQQEILNKYNIPAGARLEVQL